jgi:phage regulator Rha-like protein
MQELMSTVILTMTSLEISELVESRHDNVRTSIERLAEKGVIRLPAMQDAETINNLGFKQNIKVYCLGKRDSYVVVAQLSPEFTGRLVDRWQELEAGLLRTPALPEYQAKLESLEADLARSKLKSNAFDLLSGTAGTFCLSDGAKMLGVPQEFMFDELKKRHWIFKRSARGKWMPYADKERRGFLKVCTDVVYDEEGQGTTYPQTRLTVKGLARLAVIFAPYLQRLVEEGQKQLVAPVEAAHV